MAVLGVHIALHWKWIIGSFKNLKIKSDFHHLTEIKTIFIKKNRQLLLVVLVSTLLSLLIWLLNYSEWADGFRINSGTQNGQKSNGFTKSWMMYVLPLIKVTIIITIPALIVGAILRLKKVIKKNIRL